MLVPFLIGFLAVASRRPGWRSRRRAPWRRSCPAGRALAATIPLGVLAPSLTAGAAGASCCGGPRVAWAAARARRREALVGPGRGSAAAATAGSLTRGRSCRPSQDSWCPTPACLTACCSAAGSDTVSRRRHAGAARAEDRRHQVVQGDRGPRRPSAAAGRPGPVRRRRPGYRRRTRRAATATGRSSASVPPSTALHAGTTAVVRVRFRPGLLQRLAADARRADQHRPRLHRRSHRVGGRALQPGDRQRPRGRRGRTYATSTASSRWWGTELHPHGTRRASRARSSDSRAGRSSTTTCSPSTAESCSRWSGSCCWPATSGPTARCGPPRTSTSRPTCSATACWDRNG